MNAKIIPFVLLLVVPVAIRTVAAQTSGEYELLSGAVGIAYESSGGEYTVEGFIEADAFEQYNEYELLSGAVGIAGESSGGEYSQTGSVVLTAVDANELSGGDYTVVEESPAEVDCVVDIEDFARFAAHWQEVDCSELNDWCGGADLDNLGFVDVIDLALFVYDWLYYCPYDWPLR